MISIRKYLDGEPPAKAASGARTSMPAAGGNLAQAALRGYSAALHAIARCGASVCPALGPELNESLGTLAQDLARAQSVEAITAADTSVCHGLQEWGQKTARHYQVKAAEVKEILLALARTAESVGERDQRCAQQISAVTVQLKSIANLEDLTEIRASVEQSAAELKVSIDRMTAEGKAVLERLRSEVSTYQAKFEEAEQLAWRDGLTRLSSRLWLEGQIENRIHAAAPFCAAILDLDDFKRVNDAHGHMAGDELLRQFATELRSACRGTDVVGRWGGDEFIVVLDCALAEAEAQIARVRKWVCGNYTVAGSGGPVQLRVEASIGVAEYTRGDTMQQLLERADRAMYRHKTGRGTGAGQPAKSS